MLSKPLGHLMPLFDIYGGPMPRLGSAISLVAIALVFVQGDAISSSLGFRLDPSLKEVNIGPLLIATAKKNSEEAQEYERSSNYLMALYKYEEAIKFIQSSRKSWYEYYLLGSAELDAARMHVLILNETGRVPKRGWQRWWDAAPRVNAQDYLAASKQSTYTALSRFPLISQSPSDYEALTQIRLNLAIASYLLGEPDGAKRNLESILRDYKGLSQRTRLKSESLAKINAAWVKRGKNYLKVMVAIVKIAAPKYGFLGDAVYTLVDQW